MHRRQPPPRLWLMTDERQGDALWTALARLPRGAGIVFRHYSLAPGERRRLFERVRRIAARRGLVLVLAGDARTARAWGADGCHGRDAAGPRAGLRTMSAHSARELVTARRAGADLVFLSPVFATRSHPGGGTLGRVRFGLLARQAAMPVIALGGMDGGRARALAALGASGWAAIDAWSGPASRGS